MIIEYGKRTGTIATFTATAILRPKTQEKCFSSSREMIDTVTVHTDGVSLSCEHDLNERRAGFIPAMRMSPGKEYRITVEELGTTDFIESTITDRMQHEIDRLNWVLNQIVIRSTQSGEDDAKVNTMAFMAKNGITTKEFS